MTDTLFDDVMPESLRRFNPADWPSKPLPTRWGRGWNAGKTAVEKAAIWRTISRRQAWMDGRMRWMASRGITPAQVLQARRRRDADTLRPQDRSLLVRMRYPLEKGVPFWRPEDWMGTA